MRLALPFEGGGKGCRGAGRDPGVALKDGGAVLLCLGSEEAERREETGGPFIGPPRDSAASSPSGMIIKSLFEQHSALMGLDGSQWEP